MSTSPVADGAHRADVPLDPAKASTGQLIGELPELVTRLVRDEVRLAQAEVKGKAKKLGLGVGLFGGAGVLALLGLNALITAGILGLANVIPGWLAGILVAVVQTAERSLWETCSRRLASSCADMLRRRMPERGELAPWEGRSRRKRIA